MDLNDLIATLRFRFGNKSGLDTDILREIQFAQMRLEEDPTIDYWFLITKSTIAIPANTITLDFPTGFIREYDTEEPLLRVGEAFVPLTRVRNDQALTQFGETATGTPQVYVIYNELLQVYPKTDKEYILDFWYSQRQATLTTDEQSPILTNKWTENAFQVLLNKAGIAIAQSIRDKEALANFTNDFNVAFAELINRNTFREEANFDYQRRKESGDALGSRY